MSWRKDVIEVFKELSTEPSEWKPCDMDYDGDGAYMAMGEVNDNNFVHWKIPEGYKMAETKFSSGDFSGETRYEEEGAACCHLCGHWIIHECWIQHDEKQLVMKVGSSCVESFDIPGLVAKKRRQYIAKVSEKDFGKLSEKVLSVRAKLLTKKIFIPKWLWNADKVARGVDTTRKRINFLKKYTVLMKEAAMEQRYNVWRCG